MKLIKTLKSLPFAVAAAAVLTAMPVSETSLPLFGAKAVYAQQKTRKVPAMSAGVHKDIQKAQEAMDVKDFVTTREILAEILAGKKVNDYERAVVWQVHAMLAYEEDDVQGTIRAYEQILRYKDSIPEALELSIMYNLAQLYYSVEKYDLALQYINEWEPRSEVISVNNLVFISQLHYTRNDFERSLYYIYRAIRDAEMVDTVEVKETWYQLALSAHWELKQYEKVRDVLEVLLINWPKPRYWTQLAGVYQELGDNTTSYSLTEAAYKQGFLDDKPIMLVNLAQIQLARRAPIKCTWILEKAFKEERVEKTVQNQKTLGQCYMLASEWEKAVDPLIAAAKGDKDIKADGDLWLQIGQVLMQLDRHKDAVEAFDEVLKAFAKDRSKKAADKRMSATMQRGTALTELKKFDEARKAFDNASKLADTKRERNTIRQWRNYLKAEEAREKMLKG